MNVLVQSFGWRPVILLCGSLLLLPGCIEVKIGGRPRAHAPTTAQVERIATELDKRTTETGSYIRAKPGEINEKDAWGTQIQVDYSQGGVAEMVSVRSAGPDRQFHTEDDVVTHKSATNLKGIGEGVKKNAGETAANVAKGVVKGTVDGVKESVKESLPFKRKKKPDSDEGDDAAEPQPEKDEKPAEESHSSHVNRRLTGEMEVTMTWYAPSQLAGATARVKLRSGSVSRHLLNSDCAARSGRLASRHTDRGGVKENGAMCDGNYVLPSVFFTATLQAGSALHVGRGRMNPS